MAGPFARIKWTPSRHPHLTLPRPDVEILEAFYSHSSHFLNTPYLKFPNVRLKQNQPINHRHRLLTTTVKVRYYYIISVVTVSFHRIKSVGHIHQSNEWIKTLRGSRWCPLAGTQHKNSSGCVWRRELLTLKAMWSGPNCNNFHNKFN